MVLVCLTFPKNVDVARVTGSVTPSIVKVSFQKGNLKIVLNQNYEIFNENTSEVSVCLALYT